MENFVNIKEELTLISPFVGSISDKNLYSISAGYFDGLADEVISAIKIAKFSKNNTYTVPEKFFDELPAVILSRVTSASGELFLSRKEVFDVPGGYFDNLAGNILDRIRLASAPKNEVAAELEGLSPILNSINKKNVYTVPDGYFDNFVINTIGKAETYAAETAKVVSISKGKKNFFKYAVAASVATIVALGGYLYNSRGTVPTIAETLPSINIEQSVANLSEDDINNYLNSQASLSDPSPVLFDAGSDIQDFLDNTSEEEIKQYLNDNLEPGEKKS